MPAEGMPMPWEMERTGPTLYMAYLARVGALVRKAEVRSIRVEKKGKLMSRNRNRVMSRIRNKVMSGRCGREVWEMFEVLEMWEMLEVLEVWEMLEVLEVWEMLEVLDV